MSIIFYTTLQIIFFFKIIDIPENQKPEYQKFFIFYKKDGKFYINNKDLNNFMKITGYEITEDSFFIEN